MSSDTPNSTSQKPALEFKSGSFKVPALILTSSKIAEIKQQLQIKISQAPDFFKNSPLLIDTLRNLDFIPIAISGATQKQNTVAMELGIAVQSVYGVGHLNTPTAEQEKSDTVTPTAEVVDAEAETVTTEDIAEESVVENKLITQPVRSGQRIYAKGDLTVLAPVSSSAELIAEGNIHVYAPMRGRALAGVQGDTNCYIFCSDLQAELISIAGVYKLNEELDESLKHTLVQVYLHDQDLLIKKL
jgi:septum site-determining protein MinC